MKSILSICTNLIHSKGFNPRSLGFIPFNIKTLVITADTNVKLLREVLQSIDSIRIDCEQKLDVQFCSMIPLNNSIEECIEFNKQWTLSIQDFKRIFTKKQLKLYNKINFLKHLWTEIANYYGDLKFPP
jgi:hypothetical protein